MMTSFQVYTDEGENANRVVKNALKTVKESKVDLVQRSVLGDVLPKNVRVKQVLADARRLEDKDVSDKLRKFKLDCENELGIKGEKKGPLQENVVKAKEAQPVEEDSLDDSSLSDISVSDIDPVKLKESEALREFEDFFECGHYGDDVYSYLKAREHKLMPKAFYMRKQPDITDKMRAILVDWLVEVGEEYNLLTETLFMAVSFVDRFLSTMAVTRSKLQLLGTTAMFVAAKYEEIYPPDITEFTYITDDTYTTKQVLKMEQLLLKTLSFDISPLTHNTFINHLCTAVKVDDRIKELALYICELCVLEGDRYLQFPPSLVACGAIALASHCCGNVDVWPKALRDASGYSLTCHLSVVLPHLNSTHASASPQSLHQSSRTKYSSTKHKQVAAVPHRPLVVRKPTP